MLRALFKMFLAICVSLGLFGSMTVVAYAEEPAGAQIELLSVRTKSDYPENEVEIEYAEDEATNTFTAIVRDAESGEVLERFTETPDIPIAELRAIKGGDAATYAAHNYNTTLARTVNTDVTVGGTVVKAYTWVDINVTADSSWAQIERVNAKGHQTGGSGAYNLEQARTTVRTTRFPTNTVLLEIHGMVAITNTSTLGLSFGFLKAAGFEMYGEVSTSWTARKPYSNRSISFSVM